jgi:hypothetical protein
VPTAASSRKSVAAGFPADRLPADEAGYVSSAFENFATRGTLGAYAALVDNGDAFDKEIQAVITKEPHSAAERDAVTRRCRSLRLGAESERPHWDSRARLPRRADHDDRRQLRRSGGTLGSVPALGSCAVGDAGADLRLRPSAEQRRRGREWLTGSAPCSITRSTRARRGRSSSSRAPSSSGSRGCSSSRPVVGTGRPRSALDGCLWRRLRLTQSRPSALNLARPAMNLARSVVSKIRRTCRAAPPPGVLLAPSGHIGPSSTSLM